MNIILIGMPGSGKSTLGRVLATKLQYQFVDVDERIEAYENKTIASIFAEHGEDYFRALEREVLNIILKEPHAVIATGGGAPCFYDNMEQIRKNGISIYLQVSQAALLSRLQAGIDKRPMLSQKSDEDLKTFLLAKLAERSPFYEQAAYIFEGDTIRAEEIISKIRI